MKHILHKPTAEGLLIEPYVHCAKCPCNWASKYTACSSKGVENNIYIDRGTFDLYETLGFVFEAQAGRRKR